MVSTLDLLAVIYAYLLTFIILSIIVASIKASTWFIARKGSKPSAPPQAPLLETPAPELEVVKDVPRSVAISEDARVAAAVAAVAAHLSLHSVKPSVSISQSSHLIPQLWVHQWRAQVNKSPNELCLTKSLYRKTLSNLNQ